MTYFGNIYGQFKIEADALSSQSEKVQEAIQVAARSADWTEDSNGNLLSPIIPLRIQDEKRQGEESTLTFPWNDQATRAAAFRAAHAQLVAFDAFAHSPRGGDVNLRYSGHLTDERGDPLFLFSQVPRTLAHQVSREIKNDLRFVTPDTPAILAYRVIPTDESVRTLEVRSIYLPRRRRIEKVKEVKFYEHFLRRQSKDVIHEMRLLAQYAADQASRNVSVKLFGGKTVSNVLAHALSAYRTEYFGEGDDQKEGPPLPNQSGRELLAPFKPADPPPPAPVPAPNPKPKEKKPVPPVTLPPELQPNEPPPPVPPLPEPTPEIADDPWERLSQQVAVDDVILKQARIALDRCKPLLLTGAPGTGKTLLARALAELYSGEKNFDMVTADARWTSTDVIGGMRVTPGEGLRYTFMPGVVTEAAMKHQESKKRNGKPFTLVIDEFNRANQDEAFGRLLTLLDTPYRDVMPLVSDRDGALTPVFLPHDFILIATMNDADAARLHEVGAALGRRFTILKIGVPKKERDFLTRQLPDEMLPVLEELYQFIGDGNHDGETTYLRDVLQVGTYFVKEALATIRGGASVDEAIATQLPLMLAGLGREDLTAIHGQATRCHLPMVAAELETSLNQKFF